MNKRSEQDWRDLFAAQVASGISAQQFCKKNDLCPKHFSLRKKQLAWNEFSLSAFVPVVAVKKSPASAAPVMTTTPAALVLRHNTCACHFEILPGADWLAQLMRALV